jgi:predicted dehydrogenase
MKVSKRKFVKQMIALAPALVATKALPAYHYRRIRGANERVHVSIMGVNSRGLALAQTFAKQSNATVLHSCDVDRRALQKCNKALAAASLPTSIEFRDFRKSLESKEIDALVIAAPDHWHVPAALIALQAGKEVYLEKPCSHHPAEGERLVRATAAARKAVQMGNQRRSYPRVIEAIQALHDGIIGKVYFGKGWYTNNRASIGTGQLTSIPDWLDWDLWQGPAPRRPYKDNIVHYNWHWFWHWGTGESLNNGTHMIDLLRWGMQVDFPTRVSSHGGRYRYQDDWETPDTQVINLDFANGKSMSWEGRSCHGRHVEKSSVGVEFYGETGSLYMDGGDGYIIYDLNNKIIKEIKAESISDPLNRVNPSEYLDSFHIQNFFDGIHGKNKLHADIDSGHKSTLLMQLGNIAWRTKQSLEIDPLTGRILRNPAAMKYWTRDYQKGWSL